MAQGKAAKSKSGNRTPAARAPRHKGERTDRVAPEVQSSGRAAESSKPGKPKRQRAASLAAQRDAR